MLPRVLQVMAGAPVGGVETFFYDAVVALAEAGLPQHAVVRPNAPFHLARLAQKGVPYTTTTFSPWLVPLSRRAMRQAIASFKPDIVQYWTGRAAMTAVPTSARQVAWYGGYRERWRFKTCTDFIALTHDVARHIAEQGVAPEHLSVIHTFADYTPAAPLSRSALDTPDDVPLLLALARLHWMKGLDVLLNALPAIPRAHLWIAGEGPDRAKLVRQTEKLGLTDRVRFLGWRNDREALLATADICVVPSKYESFGTVMIEAWAAGAPLVAAAAQGPAAYVETGKNGLLVPMDDPEALAAAIRRIVDDPALRARLVQGGLESYEQCFTKKVYVRDMLNFYDRVMRSAP